MEILGIRGIGEVQPGDDIAALLAAHVRPGDIVVIAQKIVSKAEGRTIAVSSRAELRSVVRREARRIVRETEQHLIVETQHGFVCANAGVDQSNVQRGQALLLPRKPDASAARIQSGLESRCGEPIAVIISDTFGRAWRIGHTDVAIGASGIGALRDYRGQSDGYGNELKVTIVAQIDELAGAAELVMGKLGRIPAAVVRGYDWTPAAGSATDLVRPAHEDLFR